MKPKLEETQIKETALKYFTTHVLPEEIENVLEPEEKNELLDVQLESLIQIKKNLYDVNKFNHIRLAAQSINKTSTRGSSRNGHFESKSSSDFNIKNRSKLNTLVKTFLVVDDSESTHNYDRNTQS